MTSWGRLECCGRCIYGTLQKLRSSVPGIQVVRHEDLALQIRCEGFRELYRASRAGVHAARGSGPLLSPAVSGIPWSCRGAEYTP